MLSARSRVAGLGLRAVQSRVAVVSLRPIVSTSAGREISAMSTKLYVGNLSWDTRAEDLYSLFGKYGAVVSLVSSQYLRAPRPCPLPAAFIRFSYVARMHPLSDAPMRCFKPPASLPGLVGCPFAGGCLCCQRP